jgi:hypothetical protein
LRQRRQRLELGDRVNEVQLANANEFVVDEGAPVRRIDGLRYSPSCSLLLLDLRCVVVGAGREEARRAAMNDSISIGAASVLVTGGAAAPPKA